MDGEITQSEQWLRFLAWLEDNWRRVAAVASVVIGVGVVVAFVMWQGGEKQKRASEALSMLLIESQVPGGKALQDFANQHPGTMAGSRALLLAGGAFFTEGEFQQAQSQFERFLAEEPPGPLTAQARFGVAACREAQGQIEGAIKDYKSIVENPAGGNVIPEARFALGNLYAEQGEHALARAQYQELADGPESSLSSEARSRLAQLPPAPVSHPMEIHLPTPSGAATNRP